MQISETLTRKVIGAFGENGMHWLERLPEIVEHACERWSLKPLSPYEPLSYNYVLAAVDRDNQPVVLKIGVPRDELTTENAALSHFDGNGMVRLLDSDNAKGLLLLERIEPGTILTDERDETKTVAVFAEVISSMKKSPTGSKLFPHVADWAKGFARYKKMFEGKSGPIPESTIAKAEMMMDELIESSTNEILLHGDLHHFNILLSGSDQWVGIDPKGIVGEIEYEASAFLRNPYNRVEQMPTDIFVRRIDQLCEELQFDRKRIVSWSFAQTVLSSVWSLADQDDWQADLACAERFERLI